MPDLWHKTIDGSDPGPHLLITGGVHGDEFEPMVAIRRLMSELSPNGLRGKVTLVPVVNEPAFRRGSRTADDRLDLARVCPGRADGSITERIAHSLSRLIRSADFYVDLHSGGAAMRIWPLVGYVLHPNPAILDRQRRMARAFNLPLVWGTSAALDGRSLSVARDANVPAIYAEWGGAAGCDPEGVSRYVEGCLDLMADCRMLDRPTSPDAVELVVEDDRQASGHLQLCYPSPIDGIFQPSVSLGATIDFGQPLGQVLDTRACHTATIEARERGIVLCLRAFSHVCKGDSLAVILERNGSGDTR